ncbi:unnamed protein product [Rhizophagus irregularis]|nr:unnamed protein product [Rhizophagus irregularis]
MTPRGNQENEPLLGEESRRNKPFKFTPEELGRLIDPKNPDLLREYGGTEEIAKSLGVDSDSSDKGFNTNNPKSNNLQAIREYYGRNILPEAKQRTLLLLIWEACQDRVLSMFNELKTHLQIACSF